MRIQSVKRFAIGFVAVLLFVAGYYWVQPKQEKAPTEDQSAVAPDTAVVVTEPDTVVASATTVRRATVAKKPPIASQRTRTSQTESVTDQPDASKDQEPTTLETVKAPAPPACDQLVMRSGDLIDARILEVGVSEIRYKRCNREDGPDYVVSKSDALSIRFANGDVERFSR